MCKVNYENTKNKLMEEGYTLLNESISSTKDKLFLICSNGHEYSISYSNFFFSKRRCAKCKKYEKGKNNFKDFCSVLEEESYIMVDELKPILKHDKCSVKCSLGHDWKVCFTDFLLGIRCQECSGNRKLSQKTVEKTYANEGYKLISIYQNAHSNIIALCPQGHSWEHSYSNFLAGNRCGHCCTSNLRHDLEKVKEIFFDNGFIPTFSEYSNNKQQLSFICSKHPEYGEQTCSLHNLQRGLANCQVCYRNKFRGENSSNWTGGYGTIAKSVREFLYSKWTFPSLELYGFKCVLSGATECLEVHHLNGNFHLILEESLYELGFQEKKKLSDYTPDELFCLNSLVLEKHEKLGLGVPLERKIHKLFHKLYGSKNNTKEQFVEFSRRFKNNEFSDVDKIHV